MSRRLVLIAAVALALTAAAAAVAYLERSEVRSVVEAPSVSDPDNAACSSCDARHQRLLRKKLVSEE